MTVPSSAAIPSPPALDESLTRQVPRGADTADLVARWIERAAFHSIKVLRSQDSPAAIAATLDACLAPHPVTRSILNARNLEERFGIAGYLTRKNIAIVPWGSPDCVQAVYACELSITDCRAAHADTGSVMVWSDASFGRSSTLVIPIHIVLLPASRILPDLVDGLAFIQRQNPGRLPSNVILINGPSKTADIEMNLITGVHGPKHLYVVVIDDL